MTVASKSVFPIFVGSGRSGTTLVQAIFSAHSELAVAHESMFVPRLAGRDYMLGGVFQVRRFIGDLQTFSDYNRLGVDEEGLTERLYAAMPTSYPDAVRLVFAQYAEQHGKIRYGDKSPGYVLHMERLAELFPEGRFVHIIHDGRDVALSYLERSFGPSNIPDAALFWQRRVRTGRKSGEVLGPARYRELRYEELIESPNRVIRDLCPFLELAFEPEMLRYFDDGEGVRAATTDPSAHHGLRLPPTKGLRDWRKQMEVDDLAMFEMVAGRTLDECGYERGSTGASSMMKIGASVGWTRWQMRRAKIAGRRLVRRTLAGARGQS